MMQGTEVATILAWSIRCSVTGDRLVQNCPHARLVPMSDVQMIGEAREWFSRLAGYRIELTLGIVVLSKGSKANRERRQ